MACQETARIAIAAHITASPRTTKDGLEATSAEAMLPMPILRRASTASASAPRVKVAKARRRTAVRTGRRLLSGGSSDGSRCGLTRGLRSALRRPVATASRWRVVVGCGTAIASR